jgi:hypothetical protein
VTRLPDRTIKWSTPSGTHPITTPHRLARDEHNDNTNDKDHTLN